MPKRFGRTRIESNKRRSKRLELVNSLLRERETEAYKEEVKQMEERRKYWEELTRFKPFLFKSWGVWRCYKYGTKDIYGDTPKEAYDNWVQYNKEHEK